MTEASERTRTLIVGAGGAGRMVAQEMASRTDLGYVAVGFLDDDPEKTGTEIAGLPVYGRAEDLASVAEAHDIGQIVIAIPSASGRTIREIVALCEEAERPFKIVPGVWEIILGDVTISQLRDLRLEDLLGRETVSLDTEEMRGFIEGRRVLVTGAGGSIGSELARQVAAFEPSLLLLMGRGENSIYQIDQEMGQRFPTVKRELVIGSITDEMAVESVFKSQRPDIVFHAAAHKHVHLMEFYPDEAVKNNVVGTRHLIDASVRYGADRLVMLSTDKAVSPRGTMGASKRLAELLLIDRASRGCDTKLMGVRFGNVLGSRGSVVPMFRRQIARGGPVTVTHPDVTRYFMTIKEAAMLVLEAAFLGTGGEIFVLDMGEPIRIADLAEHLIRLSGLEPGKDIAIEYTGLRPGEKLHEELWTSDETLVPTRYDKISVLESDSEVAPGELAATVQRLERLAVRCEREQIAKELERIFPNMSTKDDNER